MNVDNKNQYFDMNDPIIFVEKVMGILFYVNFLGVAVLSYLYVDEVKPYQYSWYGEDVLLLGFIFILGCFLHLFSWSMTMMFIGMAKDLRSLNKKN